MSQLLNLTFLILISFLSGCAAPSVVSDRNGTSSFVSSTGISFAAWNPDSRRLALAGKGVELRAPEQGTIQPIHQKRVSAIAWSPDGMILAVATSQEDRSLIEFFDTAGQLVASQSVPGTCLAVYWREDALLVLEARLVRFTFGGNYKLVLSRLSTPGGAEETLLYETTVRPAVADAIRSGTFVSGDSDLNSAGDTLAVTQLHDPPAGRPYLKLAIWYLPTGETWVLGDIEPGAGSPVLSGDGESVSITDSQGDIRSWNIWTRQETELPAGQGLAYTLSPEGRYRWEGDRLVAGSDVILDRDGIDLASYSPDGAYLFLSAAENGWILKGLSQDLVTESPSIRDPRVETLRSWRSRDLISADEYTTYRQRLP